MNAHSWGDNDRHSGPFTYGRSKNGSWSVVLDSGRELGRCAFRITTSKFYLLVALPQVIKPGRPAQDFEDRPREYGFSLSNDGDGTPWFLQVFLGLQTYDSSTTQSWCAFLPWTDWRHIRLSFYDLNGVHFWTEWERDRKLGHQWKARQAIEKACPKAIFEFDDYDGKRIRATTRLQEREWRFGTKWCRWLSWFRKPLVCRSLDIEFSEEVGPDKGSWKGGVLGHGIELLPYEMHEDGFRRYCEQEHNSKNGPFRITYVGKVNI